MKSKIYGRKVESEGDYKLLITNENATTSSFEHNKPVLNSISLIKFETASLIKAVDMLRQKNIEGYVIFEGENIKHSFNPSKELEII